MNKFKKYIMLIVFSIVVIGCSSKEKEFVVAYLPQEETTEVLEVHAKFEDELSKAIGMKVKSYQATSYNAAIEAMAKNKIDLAMYGPFSYTVARNRASGKALGVISNPNVDSSKPASCFIVKNDSDIKSIHDLKGKVIAFGDPVSTTGNLFPKYKLMNEIDLSLDQIDTSGRYFKESTFSGGHDKTAIGVAQGSYDVGAVYCGIIDMMVENKLIKKGDLRVIGYAGENLSINAPMAINGNVDVAIQDKVKSFLLNYKDDAYFKAIGLKGGSFIEVDEANFDDIKEVAVKLGLSEEELLKEK